MRLLTIAQNEQLIRNGLNSGEDHFPVVKLVTPEGIWLLTEIDPGYTNIARGLRIDDCCAWSFDDLDLNDFGFFQKIFSVYVDHNFKEIFPISVYEDAFWFYKRLIEDETTLSHFVQDIMIAAKKV